MRVIAGELRGRKLRVPEGDAVRPTTDRVREAVFNSLLSTEVGDLDGATVLDLFAGTGAMGFEALSRGAARCDFVDSSAKHLDVVKANAAALGVTDRCRFHRSLADRFLMGSSQDWDLVIADPPYDFDEWPRLLTSIDARALVIESGRKIELPPSWNYVRERSYGSTVVGIAVGTEVGVEDDAVE